MQLSTLKRGQHAVIRRVSGPRALVRRLLELGLLPGTHVAMVRCAPMGDPFEISLRGYSLSVRKADAAQIAVELHGSPQAAAAPSLATQT